MSGVLFVVVYIHFLTLVTHINPTGRLESQARWLKGFIDKQDIHQIQKYVNEMPEFIEKLESKFGDDEKVVKFVAEMKVLVESGRQAAGAATRKEEIEKLKGECVRSNVCVHARVRACVRARCVWCACVWHVAGISCVHVVCACMV